MLKKFCVLAVDDEQRILNFLQLKLKASGYDVITAGNGPEAITQVKEQEPDLVVLDVMMPGMDGFETLKEIRTLSSVPVIILSVMGSNLDKVSGLTSGADDYMTKPFSPDELVARIEAVRRRLDSAEERKTQDIVSWGDISVDFSKHSISVEGNEIRLTKIEWLLISELARNAGRLMLHEVLLARVWGPEYRDDVQLLRTWISRLRRKIERDTGHPALIRTIPKTGYMIEPPAI
jgi:two-component system KDP operon response regulator KdpE